MAVARGADGGPAGRDRDAGRRRREAERDAGGAAGGSWSEGRFGKRLQKIEVELNAIMSGIPQLEGKCKNLNLVLVGLRIFSDLASKGDAARTAFESFRRARDASAARAALADLSSAVEGMSLLGRSALQKGEGAP